MNANLRFICCLLLVWCHRSTAEPGRLLLQDVEEASGVTGRDETEGSDSLRPALEAISRRQRDLAGRPFDSYGGLGRYRYENAKRNGGSNDLRPLEFLSMAEEGEGQPEDIGYGYQRGGVRGGAAMQGGGVGRGREQTAAGARALERLLMEYLEGTREEQEEQEEEQEGGEEEGVEDERRSAFRERGARSGGAPGRFVGPPFATTAFRERLRADAEGDEGEEEDEKKKRFLAAVKRLEEEAEQEAEEGEEETEGGARRRRRGGRNTAEARVVPGDEDSGYDDDVNKLDAYLELLEDLWEKYKTDNTGKTDGGNCDKDNEERREMKKRLRGGSRNRNRGDGGPGFDYFNSPIGWMGGGGYDAFGRRRRGDEGAVDEEQRLRNLYYALKSSGYAQKPQLMDNDEESEAYRKQEQEPEAWLASREKPRRWAAGEGEELEYGPRQRRFPVAKRAFKRSYVAPTAAAAIEEGTKRKKKEIKTDPKVAEALSHIFGDGEGAKGNETKARENGTTEGKKKEGRKEVHEGEEKKAKEKVGGEKEVVEERKAKDEEKKEVKKSVDWSEYFGMDRRKKKSEGDSEGEKKKRRTAEEEKLDDWLLNQYYKTLAMSTNAAKRKRGGGPVQEKRSGPPFAGASRAEEETEGGEESEDAMDDRLRKVEDAIVEEAIKDTGAHEGTPGGRKEAEEVRGRVLSRLAAAYSLEKMRKALGEFKASLQDEEGKDTEENGERLSDGHAVKLAQRRGPEGEREEERSGGTEEEERKRKKKREEEGMFLGPPIAEPLSEGYMGGGVQGVDVRENDIVSGGECPALDRLTTNCEGIGDLAGDYQHLFLDLCNWHEVCSICGSAASSSNRAAVSSCDITFLREVESLCHGHEECRHSGRRMAVALRALRGRGAQHHHQAKSASLCWQHPCLADFLARKRRR